MLRIPERSSLMKGFEKIPGDPKNLKMTEDLGNFQKQISKIENGGLDLKML